MADLGIQHPERRPHCADQLELDGWSSQSLVVSEAAHARQCGQALQSEQGTA